MFIGDGSTTTPHKLEEMFESFAENYLQLRDVPDSRDAPEDATVYISTSN